MLDIGILEYINFILDHKKTAGMAVFQLFMKFMIEGIARKQKKQGVINQVL